MISRNNTSGFAGRRSRDEDKCYVNLYGVIVAFKLPQLAKTGQWFMSIELVDESISPGDHSEEDVSASEEWKSVSLVIFEKQRERLPSLKAAGDVLRLHRVVVQVRNRRDSKDLR